PIGGLLVGCDENRQLDAQELHFLNEVLGYLGRRIRDEHLSGDKQNDINAFSDELISEKLDEDAIFERACKTISEVTNADSAIFWQYNKGFGFLFPKFFHFREGNIRHHASDKSMIFPEKDGFLTEMLKQNEVRAVENIIDHSQLSPTSAKTFSELHYRNVLVTPVKMGNTLSGLLIANKTDSDRQFSVWELHKAGEIVDRIRQVVRGVRTVKEANLQLKQLSRIFELGHEIKLDLAQEDILNRIVRSVRKGLGWNDVAILVKDELGASLQVSAKAGFSRPHNTGIDLTNSMALAAFETFLEKCQGLGNGYFYRTPEQVQPGVEAPGKSGMSGEPWKDEDLVIFPLETRGDLYGFLMVADPVNRLRPTQENISPLEYYANQSAVAIANMVLYEQLKASQQRYRSLAETMSLGLITCDLEDKVLYVNPAVRELLGKENRELIGMPLGDLFTPKSAQELQEMRETLLATESDAHTRVENLELEIVSVKADKIPVSTFAFPLFERRERSGYFLIINDLRVIKRLERMKADFNSMIVHDLRSPMNVIQGFIELIRNRVVGEINIEQEELLDIAKENVKKVLTLVDNFLIASKLDVGKFNIDPKLDEINTLIEKQVDNHRVLLKNKQITIEKDLDANLPLLFFDSLRIEQVLNNLFSNALKFTPEKGKVFVSTRLEKRNIEDNERFFARISVRDTGVGIPAHQIASIFEKYEQADENQSFNVRGTGLGLSICKEIVDLHGGEIWVESSQKDGSDFIFTLPIESSIEKIVN
ncbi:MAG: PAS domain S-box protein, partial [Calditrichaeota bacterium]|nr:PAS domain S-box protein [Calditrichota bacterium]